MSRGARGKRARYTPQPVRLDADRRAFLDGLCAAFDDLPDGAWQAACEDAIANCDRFAGLDPFEVWLAWATDESR